MAHVNFTHANKAHLPNDFRWPHLFERVYLGAYYPKFRERLIEAKIKAAERGAFYWSTFGYRSMAQQRVLYTAYLAKTGGKAAPPGKSAHQYGMADDSTFDTSLAPGLQPSWQEKQYNILGEELQRVGLVWGAGFGDRPHANWPGYVSGAQLLPLLRLWQSMPQGMPDDARLMEIWRHVDAQPVAD